MTSKIKSTICQSDEVEKDGFRAPSNYYVLNALGESHFFLTRSRATAQEWANELYGNNKYSIRSWKVK